MALVAKHTIPSNEAERLAAVRRYEVLDTPADGAFDRITRLASLVLEMPIAIVSLVDHDRIWFKSAQGLEGVEQIDRDPGLCASAILADEPWVIEDAKADPRALANPLVAGEFGLRFYAGSALRTHDGYNLGTLCVIDKEPRQLTEQQIRVLDDLAALVVDELELRLAARQQARQATELNDDVVQALTIAKVRFQLGEAEAALESVNQALASSKRILAELVEDAPTLRRDGPAA
ncbi:MAG: GAF domain-containing protein [Actinomycetota bacterium]|nr:GAF domain-containing protein [Actinomycetota bacterium]